MTMLRTRNATWLEHERDSGDPDLLIRLDEMATRIAVSMVGVATGPFDAKLIDGIAELSARCALRVCLTIRNEAFPAVTENTTP
jgi:hypothetical protein